MALTTTVDPDKIAIALGVAEPEDGGTVFKQWELWIGDALMLIQDRVTVLAVDESSIDQAKLDYVLREAVVTHVKRPDDATQVTVSVDDGSSSRTYRSGKGRVSITDEGWALLGLTPRTGRAFEVDTIPESAGVYGTDYWWSTPVTTEPQ